ncbi:hypothetical protein [Tessaracoccus coleopterorum]|nr:hypothetical protein [Tessaracoccus coleopterorum]
MLMQGPLFRLSDNDGVIAHTGRAHGPTPTPSSPNSATTPPG